MTVIIDYGMGNLRSILYKLYKLKINSIISNKLEDIEKADKLILPGVGHFATGMANLKKFGLISILNKRVIEDKIPIIGICLGMQLFTEKSEEGNTEGLAWIKGETKKFNFSSTNTNLKIPHIGWNTIQIIRDSPFLVDVKNDQRFYFVHSYYVSCKNKDDVAAITNYGCDFVSVIQHENIFGTQFHPEKSHKRGFEMIRRFAES